jgi:single-stranded-DNA-specific exonuclease
MAAGLTVERSRLGDLRAYLGETLGPAVAAARGNHGLAIDAAMTARSAGLDMIELVERAGPFGTGHPEPVFVFPAHRLDYVEAVGNGHVRLTLATGEGTRLKAIAFRAADGPLGKALLAARGRSLHVAGILAIDQWQAQRRPSLRVVDAADPQRKA